VGAFDFFAKVFDPLSIYPVAEDVFDAVAAKEPPKFCSMTRLVQATCDLAITAPTPPPSSDLAHNIRLALIHNQCAIVNYVAQRGPTSCESTV